MFRRRRTSQPSTGILPGLVSIEDAFAGIALLGGPGSGKTTGPLAEITLNLLRHGFGILWLCAKVGEYEDRVLPTCKLAGRLSDVKRFAPDGAESCDLLSAELSAPGGSIDSAASMLDMLASSGGKQTSHGNGDAQFFQEMESKAFRRAIAVKWLATGSCSLVDLYMMFESAPLSEAEAHSEEWRAKSFLWKVLMEGMHKCPNHHDFALGARFFMQEWARLSDRTRSVCAAMTSNLLDKFMSGPMARMVASGQDTLDVTGFVLGGGVLACDMPVLRFQEQGVFTAIILKTLVQRATLRRDTHTNPRPVAIIADEAQFFMVPSQDMMMQTVARQSRLISVVAFQNLPMMYTALSGDMKAQQEVDGWLSCHMTKIALANTCVTTGEYFSKLFGYSWEDVWGESIPGSTDYSFSDDVFGRRQRSGGAPSFNRSPNWRPDVPPEEFARLQKPSQGYPFAQGFVFQGGRLFENGKTWKRVNFRQRF
jgi:hypothetical protein